MPADTAAPGRFVTAFSTLGCPELAFEQVAALARAHGITCVELRALGGTVDLPAYFTHRYGTPERLAAAARPEEVAVIGIGTSLRLIGGTAGSRRGFLEYVPWAEALGVPYLRAFDGGTTFDDAESKEAGATLDWWARTRAAHGWTVDIAVETHDALADPLALQRFVDRHPTSKLLWDTHHTWRRGGENPARTWDRVRDMAVHLHVKDSVAAAEGYAYVACGSGAYPAAALRAALTQSGFAGPVSLEWERLWHPDLAPLADVLPPFVRLFGSAKAHACP